jgi:DNA polymerase-3 subunit delta'
MMKEAENPDPRETLSHPRHQYGLVGHATAEHKLLDAYKSGKFHHAWLLCGPQGIGKATLAYRLARFVLANPDGAQLGPVQNLYVDQDYPVCRRVAARGHSDLFVLQREMNPKTKKLRPEVIAEHARKVSGFFSKTAGEGGWRVCIIDAADDLNETSANAILKILEEPPKKSLFIIIAHAPGRLLPTIRSRCQRLDLSPLSDREVGEALAQQAFGIDLPENERQAVIRLGAGSPGRVMELLTSQGARQFIRFQTLAHQPGSYDMATLISIAEELNKKGAEIDFNIFADLLSDWIGNHAHNAAAGNQLEVANALARCHGEFSDSIARTNGLNLDRRQTLLMAFDKLEKILVPA